MPEAVTSSVINGVCCAYAYYLEKGRREFILERNLTEWTLDVEDIARQTIHFTKNGIQALDPLIQALESGSNPSELMQALEEYRSAMASRNENPVSARSMQSGDVDLF